MHWQVKAPGGVARGKGAAHAPARTRTRREPEDAPVTFCRGRISKMASVRLERRMDGWMDGWMDGGMDGWMDSGSAQPLCRTSDA